MSGAQASFPVAGSERYWWVGVNDKPAGPFHEAYLLQAIRLGTYQADDLVCPVNAGVWKPFADWPAFAPACANAGAGAGMPEPVPFGGASSLYPPMPPQTPSAQQTKFAAMGPAVGLLIGSAVGTGVGMFAAGYVGVPGTGGALTGAITGGIAGLIAGRSRKS